MFLKKLSDDILILIDHFLARFLALIAPKPCAICGDRLAVGESVICSVCNAHLPRTHYQISPYDNDLARLFWGRMPIERAAALFYYEPRAEVCRIIYSFKYHNHPENAEYMGRLAARELMIDGFFDGIDVIVPVPLARKRQRSRGYNQSVEMAKGISFITGIPVDRKSLARKSFIKSQTQMDRWQRIENVEGAFQLKNAADLRGKHVLVVDDVITSGSTVLACSKEIAKSGDVKISVFSLGFTKY